ncbi:MAG: adenylosuccinate synthetase [Opitutae bacterium]|jgi:adenylosuccinate synthase|nr:adenylosuccinate synthetase [Opitutae bacterium]MBT5716308.1 adenylosuccinate synthetase [Opitutae bacterium]
MTSSDEFSPNLYSVIGISMGDEGKGRVVHEILDQIQVESGIPPAGVIKVNGGANAGHTAAGLKLNLLPSGVGNPEVQNLIIGSGVVADPRKFLWEAKPLEKRGISVFKRLLIDEKTQMSDLTHRLLDLAWENYRVKQLGMENRGSTGRGISPAYCDETSQWQIFYQQFLEDRINFKSLLQSRVQRAMDTIRYVCKVDEEDWDNFFSILTEAETRANQQAKDEGIFKSEEFDFSIFKGEDPYTLNFDNLEEIYWGAGQKLVSCIRDTRNELLKTKSESSVMVAEFGQAYWLDKRHGFTPNVTASHTTTSELFASAGIPIQPTLTIGCCKAYDTKVGTHLFLTQIDHENHPLGNKLAKLEFGTSTGRQRMVGWFDGVEKGNALRYGGFDELVINKLDALSYDEKSPAELKICVAYKKACGEITKSVPRQESIRKQISPVYETMPGWKDDLSKIDSFSDLPCEAKHYLARMVNSIIESAYPDGFKDINLPRIRFVGVGPDPSQIISDIPNTPDLISKF